jgi:dephospho-CoA kinase
MNRPLQIGITGGMGAGKSLGCRIFNILGAPVYDADYQARKLMSTDKGLISRIKKELGSETYLEDGTLNRKFLSDLAFGSKDKIETLNALVHPSVATDFNQWAGRQHYFPYMIKEAAVMFESGSHKGLDRVIVVSASETIRIKRVLQRDTHRTEKQIRDIIRHQMPEKEKTDLADFIIVNDETTLLIPQVLQLDKKFGEKEGQRDYSIA